MSKKNLGELLHMRKIEFTLKKFFKGLGLKKAAIFLSWLSFFRGNPS